MAIITISRGSFSGGKMLAECLAAQLQYRCIDRDVIVERAAAQGVSHQELLDALLKPPGFLDRLRHKKYLYLALIQSALIEEVRQGSVVYHGNAGHLLLAEAGPALRIRVIAPPEFRVQMCRERLKLSESEARAYIAKVDEERRSWTRYLYGVDSQDPALYDLVVNLERTSVTEACSLVAHMAREQTCFNFGPECQAAMDNLARASQVKVALALDRQTDHLECSITADGAKVRIKGRINNLNLVDDIRRVAGAVPGVEEVDLEEIVSSTPS